MTTFAATATREDGRWILDARVPGAIVVTEVRRLDHAEGMLRDAIALALDTPPDVIEIALTIHLDDALREQVSRSKELAAMAASAQAEASRTLRETAQLLSHEGYSVRDIGRMLGVSGQRVSQLLKSTA